MSMTARASNGNPHAPWSVPCGNILDNEFFYLAIGKKSAVLKVAGLLLLLLIARDAWSQSSPLITSDHVETDGTHSFTVTNTSSAKLTGFTVVVDRYLSQGGHALGKWFYDSFFNSTQPPLSKGQSYTFSNLGASAADPIPVRIAVEDAIFSDGSSFGNPTAVQVQWDRRRWLVAGFQEVFNYIDKEIQDMTDKAGIIELLTRLRDQRLTPGMPHEERGPVAAAYNTVIGNLRDSTQPTAVIIAQIRARETARAKAVREQISPAGLRSQLPQ